MSILPVADIASTSTLGKTHKSIFSQEMSLDVWGGGGGEFPCDVSLTPKKYRFFTVDNLLLVRA